MDAKTEIKEFLASRRGNATPAQAGVVTYGPRRVPGLRRSEVAALAGVSVEYYTRIERGNLSGVSDTVLEALARALHLDDAEREPLFAVARASQPTASTTRRRRPARQQIRRNVQWLLDSITGAAAFVATGSHDVVAANRLGEALWSPLYAKPVNAGVLRVAGVSAWRIGQAIGGYSVVACSGTQSSVRSSCATAIAAWLWAVRGRWRCWPCCWSTPTGGCRMTC